MLASAIILMARRLFLKVVAEGVEERAQLDFLGDDASTPCRATLYSRPLPEPLFREFVASGRIVGRMVAAADTAPLVLVVDTDPGILARLEELVTIEGHLVARHAAAGRRTAPDGGA